MEKICPHCGGAFPCMHQNITHCDCRRIDMDSHVRDFLKKKYGDRCLCVACLEEMVREARKKL